MCTFAEKEKAGGGYYAGIDTTKNGDAFRAELTKIISNATLFKKKSYDDLWTTFKTTDRNTGQPDGCKAGEIGDVYSIKCWKHGSEQCGGEEGGAAKEGDCYNR
jgi:hypothetical protein